MTDEYDTYIEQVLTEVPDADRDAIRVEFEKYHTQFRIEPEDAVRSIMKNSRRQILPLQSNLQWKAWSHLRR